MLGKLYYSDSGRTNGTPLVLIPAMGSDHRFWDSVVALLHNKYRCFAFDIRGTGKSPRLDEPWSTERHADDVLAALNEIGLNRFAIVGCAVGAMIAAIAASKAGIKCEAAILSNVGYKTLPGAREALAERVRLLREKGMSSVIARTMTASFAGILEEDQHRLVFQERFAALDSDAYATEIEGMLYANIAPWLSDIRCPVLVIGGSSDQLLPPTVHAEKVHNDIPLSSYRLVEGGAHFIPYQRSQEFCRIVDAFLVDQKIVVNHQ